MDIVHSLITELPKKHYYMGSLLEHPDQVRRWQQSDLSQSCQKVRRNKTGKRLRIVAMDPKQDWRTLARFVEPERFKFYSMGNVNFRPIKLNPWKIPKGVYPQIWIDGVIDIYCRGLWPSGTW